MKAKFTLQAIDFEWDNRKAASNLRKHQIEFVEACEVFFDPFLQAQGDEFVEGERRDCIRLISARPVTKQEKIRYEGQ